MILHNVVESQQFTRSILDSLFKLAREMENPNEENRHCLENKIMITLFYEPSTRTRLSFESAMIRLGGKILATESARTFSSAAKGETLEDTVRVLSSYGDVIVLRHYESGASKRAEQVSDIPIINAGDGPGQHPTQALLDLYTIQKELGEIDGISIALVGDLYNGRTVRSLCYFLAKFDDIRIFFVSPPQVRMKDDIKDYLTRHSVNWYENDNLMEVAKKVDIIYQTRIQKERFNREEEYERNKGIYIINRKIIEVLQKHAIIMHPLPRVGEIHMEVDDDPRAAYFRQAENGLYTRMALLKALVLKLDL